MPNNSVDLSFTGPANVECLDSIHALLAQLWIRAPHVVEMDRHMFTTALLEVISNTLNHGGRHDAHLWLSLTVDADKIAAEFIDDGPNVVVDLDAALPVDDFAESGRGLAMARAALSEFSYARTANRNYWNLTRDRNGEI